MKYAHLLGKPYVSGSDDCYGIGRAFFKDNFDLELTDFARPDDWWLHGGNLFMENFSSQGFQTVDIQPHQVVPGDVFLLAIKSTVANHAGVYVGEGNILHHMPGRLSELVTIKGVWRNCICAIVRHKDVKQAPIEVTTISLADLILPHKRKAYEDALAGTGTVL